jgi:hypothetical protein
MTEAREPVYVSWDPGGGQRRSTGMVSWDAQGQEISRAALNPQQLDFTLQILENVKTIKVFIIEKYVPYGHVNHTGRKLVTSECIGQLKAFARRWGIRVVEQRSDIKRIAAMNAGVQWIWSAKKHMPDDIAAYLHGFYYLDKIGLIRPKVLDDKELRITREDGRLMQIVDKKVDERTHKNG